MGGVSNNYNLDLQKMQGQQGQTKTVKRDAFQQKDSRLSMDGSVFADKTGGSSGTAGTQKYENMSISEVKQSRSDAEAQGAESTGSMNSFMQEAAGYQAAAQGDIADSTQIEKDLNKETKSLTKAQKDYTKFAKQELKTQKQDAKLIQQNNAQMTELQSRLDTAMNMQQASGATGFMGDGTSDINAMTAELESLGVTTTSLQQNNSVSTKNSTKQFKTMTKASKNTTKLATKYNKVTTSALARTNSSMTATQAGISKAQKITTAGGILNVTGSSFQGIGAALSSNPYTSALGQAFTYSGIGMSTTGGVMTTVGTKGENTGAATAASLTQAGASLNSAIKTSNAAKADAKATDKTVTTNNKALNKVQQQNQNNVQVAVAQSEQLKSGITNLQGAQPTEDQQNNGQGIGLNTGFTNNASLASNGQGIGLNTGISGNASMSRGIGGNTGMSNPIGGGNTGAAGGIANNNSESSGSVNTMGSFGKSSAGARNVQNPSEGSTFASNNIKKKEEEMPA